MNKSQNFWKLVFGILNVIAVSLFTFPEVSAQSSSSAPVQQSSAPDTTLWYIILFVIVTFLVAAFLFVRKPKSKQTETQTESNGEESDLYYDNSSKKQSKNNLKKPLKVSLEFDEAFFKRLPIYKIRELKPATDFDALPISNDEALMNAMDQLQDGIENDEEVREIALRVLGAFKNQNSIESIAQIALYDLSAPLRSKALGFLAEFDHESVFETILLACADPTREVRAAGARALFRLSFDRSDAWARIAQGGDKSRMIQAVRAATEGDLVERSLERLTHKNEHYAYEAFALTCLLINSGETDLLFQTLKDHSNRDVRQAILHVIKTTKDEDALKKLNSTKKEDSLNPEIQEEIDQTIDEIGFVTA